jgi:hypothetical protein
MKPIVVYTRPRDWFNGGYTSEKLELIYVPISGEIPKKKNGKLAGDGIGDVITEKGVRTLYEVMEKYKPQVFLHWINAKIDKRVLKHVRNISPKTLIIVGEGNHPETVSPYILKNKEWTDGVLLNSRDQDVKSKYCALAYDPMMIDTLYDGFSPKDIAFVKKERIFDCFFGGNNHFLPGGKHLIRLENLEKFLLQFQTIYLTML